MSEKSIRISVIGRKGGVAKTTSSVIFASILARKRKTLLVDLDDRAYAQAWAQGDDFAFDVDGQGGLMVAGEYDAVVIDTQADPPESVMESLGKRSTHIVLPVTPERQAIKGVGETVRVLRQAGIPDSRLFILITMDTHVGTDTDMARQVLEGAGLPVLRTTITDSKTVPQASTAATLPNRLKNPKGKTVMRNYEDALKEILG